VKIAIGGGAIRPAQSREKDAVLDVILKANPHLQTRIERFRATGAEWWSATPVVAFDEDRVVSTAVIFRRSVWTRGGFARFGGIGAVATVPEMQHRGFASAVLTKCEAVLRAEGIITGILFCTIAPFYERLGWRVVHEPPLPATGSDSGSIPIEIRRVDLQRECAILSDLYEQAGTGAIMRTPQLWREQAAWQREDPKLLLGAFHRNDLVAYARARCSPDGLEVLEATTAPGFELALGSLKKAQAETVGATVLAASTVQMMVKDLRPVPVPRKNNPFVLDPSSFLHGVPWSPRMWWPVDRF